jgi:hypothetical protein
MLVAAVLAAIVATFVGEIAMGVEVAGVAVVPKSNPLISKMPGTLMMTASS